MRPENEVRLAKIKKLSWFFRAVCVLFMVFCVIALARFVAGPIFHYGRWWVNGTLREEGYYGVVLNMYSLTLHERLVALAFFTVTMTAAFFCGLQLFRLLGFYSRGEIFTRESARQICLWGLACVTWGLVKMSWVFVPLLIANSRRSHTGDQTTLFNGLIILAFSWFMDMAAEMQEENELTV